MSAWHRPLARHRAHDIVARGPRGGVDARAMRADVAALVRALKPEGDHALLTCDDPYWCAVGLLACWARGIVVVLPPNRMAATLDELCERLAIGTRLHDGAGVGVDITRATSAIDDRSTVEGSADEPSVDVTLAFEEGLAFDDDRELVVVCTSGSTGSPRYVAKTARQLLGEATCLVEMFFPNSRPTILATVPSIHIYGLLFGVLVPLLGGGSFVRTTALYPEAVRAALEQHAATVLVSVPAHLRVAAEVLGDDGPPLAYVFSSGAPLAASVAASVRRAFGCGVSEILGSTETGGIAARSRDGSEPPPRWQPLPGVRVSVGDGERLRIDSPFLPMHSRPQLVEDRVCVHDDGTFEHLGRLDDVVKVAGKRVAIGDVEHRLLAVQGVDDAAVLAVPSDDGRGQRLHAFIVGPAADANRAATELARWFDPVVVPRGIHVVDRLPREESGKLRRAVLQALLPAAAAASGVESPGSLQQVAATSDVVVCARGIVEREVTRWHVPRDCVFFRGHFEGLPILPGVVELSALILPSIRARWPELATPSEIQRLKFKQRVAPGDELELTLERTRGRARVSFELSRGAEACASGIAIFAADC